jgi:uncharacterized membrane protein YccC
VRTAHTLLGAAVGVAVSLAFPASRLVDARQTLDRLATSLCRALEEMGTGLQHPWSTDQSEEWRRTARTVRQRLVEQAIEAVGNSREVARWNVRDRRHVDELARLEGVLPRLERTAIGVSVIARGLDDHARVDGSTHPGMPAMGALIASLAGVVKAVVAGVLGATDAQPDVEAAVAEVCDQRERCVRGAARRARLAVDADHDPDDAVLEREWLGYAALLVQVDRIVADLGAPLPP